MTSLPLATVALVVHNRDRYIGEAIESILSQSYSNLELVVCDDCSTDGTWDIITCFKDPRIRSFRNPQNLGEYPNRNQALGLARGKYLIYIDSDDILYPHGLEFMVRMMESFPEAAMAMARPWSEKFVYPTLLTSRQFYLCECLGQSILADNFVHLFLRTSALREVGGFDTRYKAGDPYIQYLIALNHSCVLINDNLAWWRRTPGQASEQVLGDKSLVAWIETIEWKSRLLTHPQCPLTPEEINMASANLYGTFIRMVLHRLIAGEVASAIRLLKAAHLPVNVWKYTLVRGCYPYLSDVSASNPLGDWRRNPYAHMPVNEA